jgi:hypothetical protein
VVSDVPQISETKPKLPELKFKQPTTTPIIEEKPVIKPIEQEPVATNTIKQPETQPTATPQIDNDLGEKPTIKITSPKNGSNERTFNNSSWHCAASDRT